MTAQETTLPPRLIYKLMLAAEWESAKIEGLYRGSVHDRRDGFIHFSTAAQLTETAVKYFKGVSGLILLEIAAMALGDALRWEASRDGALFPHLYANLQTTAILRTWAMFLEADGTPILPQDELVFS